MVREFHATVADIRQQLAIEDSPGKAGFSRNFTGFWKEGCSDSFGLRTVDQPGMYTVTFCGPGGCADEQGKRKTFITGAHQNTLWNPVAPKISQAVMATSAR
jgi:hypothetical protein